MATSIFDYASFVWDGRLVGRAPGKLFPLKPNVKDLTGDFLTVTRSTVKRVLNSSGVLAEVAINTPAFEFNTDGTYRGLLVEPAATNLLLRSAEFDNAYWTKTLSTITADATTAPDGTTTADKLIVDNGVVTTGSNGNGATTRAVTVSSGTTYTWSVFAKAGEFSELRLREGVSTGQQVVFNLANGTITSGDGNANFTPFIQSYGNGWYRCGGVRTTTTTTFTINIKTGETGDGTSGIFIWGAQLETGSVATSYIPTVASTANRTADSVTLTGASSLIGQTSGTIYVEFVSGNFNSTSLRRIMAISDGTLNNRMFFTNVQSQNNRYEFGIITGGVTQTSISQSSDITNLATARFAVAYDTNDIAFYADGVQVGTDNSATIPACSVITLGNLTGVNQQFINGWIRSVALFPSRLTNIKLESLTS